MLWLLFLPGPGALLAAEARAVSDEKPAPAAGQAQGGQEDGEAAAGEPPSEDEQEAEMKEAEEAAAVASPVSADPVQVYGWREWVTVSDGEHEQRMQAKLDTGALTSSIHVEGKELFERDGKKWVRFVVTDPRNGESKRLRIEAPLVRIARIKEPGGKSEAREVVRLAFVIGDRKLKADFTLNDRHNMLSPVLIGRRTIKELGWVDPARAYLADKKVMR